MQNSTKGWILIGISLFMLMGMFNANLPFMTKFVMFFLVVVAPGAGGGYLLYSGKQQGQDRISNKKRLAQQTLEAEIIQMARKNQGRLTVIEVVSQLGIDKNHAEEVLDNLALQKIADVQMTDDGLIVYNFTELHQLSDKHQSRRLEDV